VALEIYFLEITIKDPKVYNTFRFVSPELESEKPLPCSPHATTALPATTPGRAMNPAEQKPPDLKGWLKNRNGARSF
jgi:hypothetical protein